MCCIFPAKKSKTKLNLRASAADLSSVDDGMNGDSNLEEMQTRWDILEIIIVYQSHLLLNYKIDLLIFYYFL